MRSIARDNVEMLAMQQRIIISSRDVLYNPLRGGTVCMLIANATRFSTTEV